MKVHIGIDPGNSGGIAFLPDSRHLKPWAVPMPDTDAGILEELRKAKEWGQCRCVLEKVHAMPRQGVVSVFTFGQNFGKLQMALAACDIKFEFVEPAKWQEKLDCRTGGDKNISKAVAQKLFPSMIMTHAISDALLLATFCKRHYPS